MVEAVTRLLGESVDFSVEVDPTEESLFEAVGRFLRYQTGEEAWAVSRFTCPVKLLTELANTVSAQELSQPFPVVVLGGSSADASEWEDRLSEAAEAMNAFDQSTNDWVEIDALEILPPSAVDTGTALKNLKGFSEVEVYVDLSCTAASEAAVSVLADSEWAMARILSSRPSADSTIRLANLIHECLSLEVPFKFESTRQPALTNDEEHGFLNILGATALALSENLSRREIAAALGDGERTHWEFGATGLTYRGWCAELAQIEEARTLIIGLDARSVEKLMDELSTIGIAVPRTR